MHENSLYKQLIFVQKINIKKSETSFFEQSITSLKS